MKKATIGYRKLRQRSLIVILAVTAALMGAQALLPATAGALKRSGCDGFLNRAIAYAIAGDMENYRVFVDLHEECMEEVDEPEEKYPPTG